MPQPILILLDYIERVIGDLNNGLTRESLRKTKIAFEKLTGLSDYLKELLPKKFVEENFVDFDRHMRFIKIFLEKKDFGWMSNNFDDLRKRDLPDIKKKIYDLPTEGTTHGKKFAQSTDKVFIVHGRDHKPLKELKAMLKDFGLNPIVLHEKASGSRTIVEKLEKHSDVGYVFVILTPDDGLFNLAKVKKLLTRIEAMALRREVEDNLLLDSFFSTLTKVARQNVILEFGYFMGLLGRDRVCCLYKGNIELPSDMHGIVYIPFKKSVSEVQGKIIMELKEADYKITL